MGIRPADPVARTASNNRVKVWLQFNHSILPPPYVKEEPQLLTEGGIQTAVDKWVVASGAHSQPVKTEVESIRTLNGVTGQQDYVAVEQEPADGENPNDQEQHG